MEKEIQEIQAAYKKGFEDGAEKQATIEVLGRERFLNELRKNRSNASPEPTRLDKIIAELQDELAFAIGKFKPYNSFHEGFALIKEELDELWDEIRLTPKVRERMELEAIQVAATAIRFIHDLCGEENL